MKKENFPTVTKEQMIELDRLMVEEYCVSLEQMMEDAGRSFAELATQLFPNIRKAAVLVGPGNNGGGGIVSARYLSKIGKDANILLSQPRDQYSEVVNKQLDALKNTDVHVTETSSLNDGDVMKILDEQDVTLDALLGYSIDGSPYGEVARLIEMINKSQVVAISLDLPSGLSPNEGLVYNPVVRAQATIAIAAPKKGLYEPGVDIYTGDLYIADISVPRTWYAKHKFPYFFESNTIVKL